MPTGYLTRVVEFTATHRFPAGADFGTAPKDHGHRYQCHVTVRGPFDAALGGVMSLPAFDTLLQREIVARLDRRSINDDVPEFAGGKWVPTGEALAVYLWGQLERKLPAGVALHAVRVQEGPHLYSEYFGDR